MQTGFEREIRRFQSELESSLFKDAEVKHRRKLIEIKVCLVSCLVSDNYSFAFNTIDMINSLVISYCSNIRVQ